MSLSVHFYVMSSRNRFVDLGKQKPVTDSLGEWRAATLQKAARPQHGFDDTRILQFGIGLGDHVLIGAQLFD